MTPTRTVRATRSDGERSRREILHAAARVATVHGLQHLSIGQLADEVGMSKSGLYAHFGSKEELQLATVETAEEIYEREVYARVDGLEPGLDALIALADAHLDHMRRKVFPGGCFFDAAASDLVSTQGPVRDRILAYQRGFTGRIHHNLRVAQERGELAPGEDIEQLTYDVTAYLALAHAMLTFHQEEGGLDRAAHAVRVRVGRA